ncbi:endonuclease Q family protein [Paenibacillus sediminis]|uniref:Uncharacterized protein (TIGR00375 family) n=1 Tax=Paenibacillus sediminis TaxID=664909 RepID=A0ABS4GZI9_9BACL|nr:endonuclease Q family protein [Paenibacillus sediminis]MBP1935693.1 uncharacterized protein (TIGR00375 family) [Paenibacillus sediminis]
MTMNSFYADLHIHIGRTNSGQAVKISASRDLTFANIAKEAAKRKGIQLIGIIDTHSPAVQEDIIQCLDRGEMEEAAGGGIRYQGTTILLGSEIEIRESGMGPAHVLVYFPHLQVMQDFTKWMSKYMKNVNLSSQRIYVPAAVLQDEVVQRGGLFIPAHIFTPHRSIYGSCAPRMADVLDLSKINAVELGLSADADMAGLISELDPFTILTNSDAHSLSKIGREYNVLAMKEPTFEEFALSLARQDGRSVQANYGLNPRLGKYHRTYCSNCNSIIDETTASSDRCSYCGSTKLVRGVLDRILSIADREKSQVPLHRPAYHYQVPLEFIPGLGKAKLNKLMDVFGTEMFILHQASQEELAHVVGVDAAEQIVKARSGNIALSSGGGGTYGKVMRQ